MKAQRNPGGGGGGDFHMKRSGMDVVKFELNLCLTPERCHLKRDRPDYQTLFRKGARVSRADS